MYSLIYKYLGKQPYNKALQKMEGTLLRIKEKQSIEIWGLEHPCVYTAGLGFSSNHIKQNNLKLHMVRRGGSVTVHNFGQLVIYTLLPLNLVSFGITGWIRILESIIIQTLLEYGIPSFIYPPYTGVWTSYGKIAFIGLGMKHGCIFHGISININNNLEDFQNIYSCGLTFPVTRIHDIMPSEINTTSTNQYPLSLQKFALSFVQKLEMMLQTKNHRQFIGFTSFLENKVSSIKKLCNIDFLLGQTFFNAKKFWYAHEAWEFFWKKSSGEYRIFLQGCIQLASALFKIIEKPSLKGATSLLNKSYIKLKNNEYTQSHLIPYKSVTVLEYIQNIQKELVQLKDDSALLKAQSLKKYINTYYLLCSSNSLPKINT